MNFIVLRIYAEALDRLRVRLNMYLVWLKNLEMTLHLYSVRLRRVCSDDFLDSRTQKTAIFLKWCKIWTKVIIKDQPNRTAHTSLQLVPTSMTLDDLERPKRHSCRNINVLWSLLGKNSMTVDPYYQWQHVGR